MKNDQLNTTVQKRRLKIFTWHVQGSYLFYLAHAKAEFYVPYNDERKSGYTGLPKGSFLWPSNIHEIHVADIKRETFDVILFQKKEHYLHDKKVLFSKEQQDLPQIYLEHEPPREHPVNARHWAADSDILLIHVTHFNNLMWDNGETVTSVIEHGVSIPADVFYTGKLNKGIVVVNNMKSETRGYRRMGYDIFKEVSQSIPLDVVGMGSEEIGGLGEIPHNQLPEFMSQYRFFFNPIRYTSLGLTVIEAMMTGLPVVGMATTEMAVTVQNDYSGFVHTDIRYLTERMQYLLEVPAYAQKLGRNAQQTAQKNFNLQRFTSDWENMFSYTVQKKFKNLPKQHQFLIS